MIPIHSTLRDPAHNWQINPARNWQINPVRNWQINPARNWQINPAQNWQINPAHNYQINPYRNVLFSGLFVNRVNDNSAMYFAVNSGINGIILFFDSELRFSYYAVNVQSPTICGPVFTAENNDYTGFLCPCGSGGFNWFDLNGEWLYFTS